ncbi:MAG: efflux transporter outer membrane subunit [Verrucomicrobia bacterium]|nr:MAG: efflux transporter outer membrane subunit [Verrucomicrobiota bacterium]
MLIPAHNKLTTISNMACAALLVTGCNVGPDYQRPAALARAAMPAAYDGSSASKPGKWKTAQPSVHLPRGNWWNIYHDAELDRLEGLAGSNNQQLAAAYANFQQARALVNVARADAFPQLSTATAITRQHTNGSLSGGHGSTFNSFSVPLDASWELDFWGRVRREVEATRANLGASGDDLQSAKLAVQAEVAIDYITLRALEAQRNLLEETSRTYQKSLDLTQTRRAGGIATDYDVSLAETQLKSTEAQVPAVILQRAKLLHALATLCGQAATSCSVKPATESPPSVPAIPAGVPSELLENRPDVTAAERRMAAANAAVGVASAAFYPRVTLNGNGGFQATDASRLFNGSSRLWSVGPALNLPLFTGGRNTANLAVARANYEATVANYRQTVLGAFQDVEDQLAAQRLLTQQLTAETAALQAARRTLEISNTRYQGGVLTYLEVAIAQSSALSHEVTVVQLSANRVAASVALIKALGAGWRADTKTLPR